VGLGYTFWLIFAAQLAMINPKGPSLGGFHVCFPGWVGKEKNEKLIAGNHYGTLQIFTDGGDLWRSTLRTLNAMNEGQCALANSKTLVSGGICLWNLIFSGFGASASTIACGYFDESIL